MRYRLRNGRRVAMWLSLATVLLLAGCAPSVPLATVETLTPEPGPPSSPTAALAAGVPASPGAWRSYTDPALGYSLSFPQDVEFTSGTSKAGIYTARLQFSIPGIDGYQGMVLRVEPNPERRGIEQVVEEIYRRNLLADPPPDWRQELAAVTVAGLSSVQVGQGGDFSLIVPYQDRVYIIAPVHGTATAELDPKALELFYQVLATLRLAP